MHSDLMHTSCEWPTEDDTSPAVIIEPFELRAAFFTTRRYFTNADFVTHNLHGLGAFCHTPENKTNSVNTVRTSESRKLSRNSFIVIMYKRRSLSQYKLQEWVHDTQIPIHCYFYCLSNLLDDATCASLILFKTVFLEGQFSQCRHLTAHFSAIPYIVLLGTL